MHISRAELLAVAVRHPDLSELSGAPVDGRVGGGVDEDIVGLDPSVDVIGRDASEPGEGRILSFVGAIEGPHSLECDEAAIVADGNRQVVVELDEPVGCPITRYVQRHRDTETVEGVGPAMERVS